MAIVMAARSLTGGASIPWYEVPPEIAATAGIQAAAKPGDPAFTVPRARTQNAIAVSIEGYVRFILLYLVFQVAVFLLSACTPIISFPAYRVRDVGFLPGYIVGASVSPLNLAVNVAVFPALGLPLCKDILPSLGLRPRGIFSRRLRKEVIPQRERRRAGGPPGVAAVAAAAAVAAGWCRMSWLAADFRLLPTAGTAQSASFRYL